MNLQENINTIIKPGSAKKLLYVTLVAGVMILITLMGSVVPASAGGATQISGEADLSGAGCDAVGLGDFPIGLTGDLEGCNYVTVETATCSPSGTYRETGTEYYVITGGSFGEGTFSTTYVFTGKFESCDQASGVPTGGEIFGRCQHPIVAGSGDGAFTGVTGRVDYKDFPADNYFPYRGHLRW